VTQTGPITPSATTHTPTPTATPSATFAVTATSTITFNQQLEADSERQIWEEIKPFGDIRDFYTQPKLLPGVGNLSDPINQIGNLLFGIQKLGDIYTGKVIVDFLGKLLQKIAPFPLFPFIIVSPDYLNPYSIGKG
jgi:hypothetical protein